MKHGTTEVIFEMIGTLQTIETDIVASCSSRPGGSFVIRTEIASLQPPISYNEHGLGKYKRFRLLAEDIPLTSSLNALDTD